MRNVHFEKTTSPTGLDSTSREMAWILPLIQEIREGVDDIRRRLDGARKSHYTVEEVAELTGRAPYTVRAWIAGGRIDAIRVPGTGPKGRLLITQSELDKLVGSGMGARVPAIAIG